MTKNKDIILVLENLKSEMGMTDRKLSNGEELLLLKRKQKELNNKTEQIEKEIEREIDDFFGFLNLKQASIETLNTMNVYIKEESKKVEEKINKLNAESVQVNA